MREYGYHGAHRETLVDEWPTGGRRTVARLWIDRTAKGCRVWRQTTSTPRQKGLFLDAALVRRVHDGSLCVLARLPSRIKVFDSSLEQVECRWEGDPGYGELNRFLRHHAPRIFRDREPPPLVA